VFALSTRRVSGLMMINRSTMNYRSRRDPAQPQLVAQLDQSFVLYAHPASTALISSS
jgi:hypothetical protein